MPVPGPGRTTIGAGGAVGIPLGTIGSFRAEDVFGDAQQPGLLGTGQYRVPRHQVDPNAAAFDTAPQSQVRQQQDRLGQLLFGTATGTGGPSPAELQLRQGTDRALAQAAALAASMRGPGAAAANRTLAYNQGAIAQEGNQAAALLRAQETQQAQQQLGQLLFGMRGQDLGLAGDQLQANLQLQQLLQSGALGYGALDLAGYKGAGDARGNLLGGVLGGLGTVLFPKG